MTLRAEDVLVAPWWPELLSVMNTQTYAQLTERFTLPIHVLIRALKLAGLEKAPMPRGRKPKVPRALAPDAGASAPAAAVVKKADSPADRLRREAGRMPDADVAALAGVSLDAVKAYRRDHGIAPFLRPPPGAAVAPAAAAPSKAAAKAAAPPAPARSKSKDAGAVTVRRRTDADGATEKVTVRHVAAPAPAAPPPAVVPPTSTAPAPVPPASVRRTSKAPVPPTAKAPAAPAPVEAAPIAPAPVEPAAVEPAAGETTASILERFRDQLGLVADHVVAERAGLKRQAVGDFRRKLGIPAYEGFRFGPGTTPPRAQATPAKVEPPAKRPPAAAPPAAPKAPALKVRAIAPSEVPAPPEPEATTAPREPVRRPSRLDAHLAIIGVLSDAAVAARAGVSPEGVRQYRRRNGIPSSYQSPSAADLRVVPVVTPAPALPVEIEAPTPVVVVAAAAAAPVVVSEPVVVPVAAPAPAPVVVPVAALAPAPTYYAYTVIADRGEESTRFIAVGLDLRDAVLRATAALDARADGPWRVKLVREGSEALTAPG